MHSLYEEFHPSHDIIPIFGEKSKHTENQYDTTDSKDWSDEIHRDGCRLVESDGLFHV